MDPRLFCQVLAPAFVHFLDDEVDVVDPIAEAARLLEAAIVGLMREALLWPGTTFVSKGMVTRKLQAADRGTATLHPGWSKALGHSNTARSEWWLANVAAGLERLGIGQIANGPDGQRYVKPTAADLAVPQLATLLMERLQLEAPAVARSLLKADGGAKRAANSVAAPAAAFQPVTPVRPCADSVVPATPRATPAVPPTELDLSGPLPSNPRTNIPVPSSFASAVSPAPLVPLSSPGPATSAGLLLQPVDLDLRRGLPSSALPSSSTSVAVCPVSPGTDRPVPRPSLAPAVGLWPQPCNFSASGVVSTASPSCGPCLSAAPAVSPVCSDVVLSAPCPSPSLAAGLSQPHPEEGGVSTGEEVSEPAAADFDPYSDQTVLNTLRLQGGADQLALNNLRNIFHMVSIRAGTHHRLATYAALDRNLAMEESDILRRLRELILGGQFSEEVHRGRVSFSYLLLGHFFCRSLLHVLPRPASGRLKLQKLHSTFLINGFYWFSSTSMSLPAPTVLVGALTHERATLATRQWT